MTRLADCRMTPQNAIAKLAMIASILIGGVACVALGPQAFSGGAVTLVLLGISGGMIVPTLNDRGLLRMIGLLPDIAIISVLWWLASEYLVKHSTGPESLGVGLLLASLAYVSIVIAMMASLRSSSSFRAFACIAPPKDGEPDDARESPS